MKISKKIYFELTGTDRSICVTHVKEKALNEEDVMQWGNSLDSIT